MTLVYDRRIAATDVEDEDIGEIEIADYLVFLFALDMYVRWVEDVRHLDVEGMAEENLGSMIKRGMMLLRSSDGRVFGALERLMRTTLTNKASLRMLDIVMRTPPTVRGAGVRALRLRIIMSRGGVVTTKAVFGKSIRARKQVLDAIEAAMLEDADAALSRFAAITLRNKRLEAWIDQASEIAQPLLPVLSNPIQEAAKAVTDRAAQTRASALSHAGAPPASDQAQDATAQQYLALDQVEQGAREAAQKAIRQSGGDDGPVTRAETIAIATTAVVAASADPDDARTTPPSFVNDGLTLDPEQQAAALTDGRVLVAAGAGSGKSTTLVSRIAYLVQERGVVPSKILACSFNRKAANELRSKVQSKVGKDTLDQISLGTMHSLFLRFIVGDSRAGIPAFGTPEERALFRDERLIADQGPGKPARRGPKPINMTKAIQGIFKECKDSLPGLTGFPSEWFNDVPKAKRCNLYINVWKGNDVLPDAALKQARRKEEKIAALWYQFYMGLKGDLPGWKPPCRCKAADKWRDTFRPGGERLGDLDDQLRVFRDILARDPAARKQIQSMFDHIMVDESQDRNVIQSEIFDLMAEHIGDGSDGKSLWIVGDDKQCVADDTPVAVPDGAARAGALKPGDIVLSYRNGDVVPQKVQHVVSTSWTWGYKVTTESGKSLTMSPNHKIWVSGPEGPGYLVCLMHRRGRGFWVGSIDNALEHGPQAEKAERLWVLGICADRDEAAAQVACYSLRYQVPIQLFDAVSEEFGSNGGRVLEVRGLSFDYPNWAHQTSATCAAHTVTLIAHGCPASSRQVKDPFTASLVSQNGTQVSAEWAVGEVSELVAGAEIRQGRACVRKWFLNYREGLAFAEELAHRLNFDLCHKLSVSAEVSLIKTTASAVVPGMFVAILCDGQLLLDKVVAVDRVEASFVDLDVDDASNFFGDSILSSNSIYQFRGARPEIFSGLNGKPGWKTRMIRTNYRCEPEIVEAANRLMMHQSGLIPMDARANPKKPRGKASIRVQVPADHSVGAIDTVARIGRETQEPPFGTGSELSEYAVLTRTNAELHDFETACCLAEIPYARAGGSGLFNAPESKVVLGYIDMAYGADFERMSGSLADALTKPERGLFLGYDKVARIVKDTFEDVARMTGRDVKSVNPLDLITQRHFAMQLATNLKMPYRHKMQDYAFRKAVENLTRNLLVMGGQIVAIRNMAQKSDRTAEEVLSYVLDNVSSTVTMWDRDLRQEVSTTKTLREQIQEDLTLTSDEEEEEEEGAPEVRATPDGGVIGIKQDNPAKGLGAVQFLYLMAEPNQRDAEEGTDPSMAGGFIKKLTRIRTNSDKLRVDLNAWAREQASKPEEQREKRPNCVILSTIHCSPPDEPILTLGGWVPIAVLDPARHALASYSMPGGRLFWGKDSPDGFIKDTRPYAGALITMSTAKSRTRVTAEHRVLVRLAPASLGRHVVYLMRRGEWWHIGSCVMAHRDEGSLGVARRVEEELADASWILGVFDSEDRATAEAERIQVLWGLPHAAFEAVEGGEATVQLHAAHESTRATAAPQAIALLRSLGLDPSHPFHARGVEADFREAFVLHACNILDGCLEIPVAPEKFVDGAEPEWLPVTATREHYDGPVHSLTVLPHHFYVSGGAVVHNSVKGAEWRDATVVMAPGKFPRDRRTVPGEEPPTEEELAAEEMAERNLAYVALTRAAQSLTVLCPPSPRQAGLSQFVEEAGLTLGENVPKPEGASSEVRTASWDGLDLDNEHLTYLASGLQYER